MLHSGLAWSASAIRLSTFVKRLLILSLLVGFGGIPICRAADSKAAEKFVLDKLVQGQPADLKEFSKNDQERALGHEFVEDLLSGGFSDQDKSHNIERRGVTILNAVFEEELSVQYEVPYPVSFLHCKFHGGLDLSESQFDRDLFLDGSVFGKKDRSSTASSDDEVEVKLIGTTVNGTLSFNSYEQSGEKGSTVYLIEFYVPVDFTKLHARNVVISANFDFMQSANPEPDLDMTETHVDQDFSLSVVQNRPTIVEAQSLEVDGSMTFGGAGPSPKSPAGFFPTAGFNLAHSHFLALTIYRFDQWVELNVGTLVTLDGFSFQQLYVVGAEEGSARSLLQLVDSPHCTYSPTPYLTLEQFLRSSGYPEWADDAYIRMRVRQRSDAIWYHRKLAWVSDMLLYLLTGYGKRPSNSVYIAIALVGIGMWIFPSKHMKPQDDTKKAPPYSRFWYSLDLLAPVIDLGVASVWEPKQSWWFGRNYAQLQRIAGWILLPLILAAITGLIQ